jgi:hypothetical protein
MRSEAFDAQGQSGERRASRAAPSFPSSLVITKFVGIPHDVIGIKLNFDPTDPDWQKKATDGIIRSSSISCPNKAKGPKLSQ